MSDGQIRTATVLLFVLVAILVALQFWKPAEPASDPDATAAVWQVDTEAVTRIEVERAGQDRLVLVRSGDDWTLEQPLVAPADKYAAQTLVGRVARLDKGIPVGADLATFGLAEPKIVVTVQLGDGTTKSLNVGDALAVGGQTYVLGEDGTAVAVAEELHTLLLADAEEFRDHRVVAFEPSEVTAVTLQSSAGTLHVEKQGETWWSKGFTRADPRRVEDLLLGLLDLRFDSFASPEAAELAGVTHTVTVRLADAREIRFHAVDAGELAALVRVDDGPVGYVFPGSLALLGQGPTDIGDKNAFPIDLTAASRLEVELGGQGWVLERVGEQWQRDGKEETAAEAALQAVARASIEYRQAPVPDITEPWGRIVVREGDRERIIEVGQVEGERTRVARDRAGGEPYLVPIAAIDAIAQMFR